MRNDDFDYDDQDLDDQDAEPQSEDEVANACANILGERFAIDLPHDTDAESFLDDLYDALKDHPCWELVDDDEDEEPAPRREQPQALSSGPRLVGQLSHGRKKPHAQRGVTATRGKQAALEQLRASRFFAPKTREGAARLSHGQKTKGGQLDTRQRSGPRDHQQLHVLAATAKVNHRAAVAVMRWDAAAALHLMTRGNGRFHPREGWAARGVC